MILFRLSHFFFVQHPTAQRPHNPKVAGSNPAPATNSPIEPFRYLGCVRAVTLFGMSIREVIAVIVPERRRMSRDRVTFDHPILLPPVRPLVEEALTQATEADAALRRAAR